MSRNLENSALDSVAYRTLTSDLPIDSSMTTSTFVSGTAIRSSRSNPKTTTDKCSTLILQGLSSGLKCGAKPKVAGIPSYSSEKHVYWFTLSGVAVLQVNDVKYLEMHLDSRLTRKIHGEEKKSQLILEEIDFQWELRQRSKLRLERQFLPC